MAVIYLFLIYFAANLLAFLITLAITRQLMGIATRQAINISSLTGGLVGILAAAPYFVTHIMHTIK